MNIPIIKEPDLILHKTLDKIKATDEDIKLLIENMRDTMAHERGVGLAGNQVGQNLAIFVIDANLAKTNNVPDVYINPEITEYSKEIDEIEEGCLSIPNYWHQIKRSKKIKIKYLDENLKKQKIKARGFLARVIQHETDHLNGVLIKDRE